MSAQDVSERDWQGFVLSTARLASWACYHTFDSRRSEPGFPDLVMIRDGQLLAWELKTEKGKVTAAQQHWLDLFAQIGADARVVRPSDQADVIKLLCAPRTLAGGVQRAQVAEGATVELSGQDAAQ